MKRLLFLLTVIGLYSCGLPAVDKHLTDKFYLTAPDLIEQLSVSYRYSETGYSNLVNETVVGVGFNDDFIIVKQIPTKTDSTFFYIIDINEIKKERKKFTSETDTIKYYSHYKDIYGNDSLGPEEIQILNSNYSPKAAKPMTFEDFLIRRKQLNVPENLNFTIKYEDFSGDKN